MTASKLVLGTVAASAFWLSAAQATTIINRDPSAHNLRIVEGDQERVVTAEPSQQLDELCSSSCSLFFDDDPDAYEIAAGDIVSIEDGELYYEEPSALPEAPSMPADANNYGPANQ